MASRVVTPISGFFSATRKPRMKARPTRWPVKVPGPVVTASRSSAAKARPALPHGLVHHRRQRFGMAARHLLEAMGQDCLAIQHRDRTGAQRGIDSQQFIMVALAHANAHRILHASSKLRRGLRGRRPPDRHGRRRR